MENVIGGRKEGRKESVVASERKGGGLPWAPIYYTGGKRGGRVDGSVDVAKVMNTVSTEKFGHLLHY